MKREPVGAVIRDRLDPVLTPAGFAAGQGGDGASGQVIYCAGYDEFSDRYDRLPQAHDQARGVGACVDLVIEVSDIGGVAFVDLEGYSLEETLRRVGCEEDADRAASVVGMPLPEALPILEGVLRRVFDESC